MGRRELKPFASLVFGPRGGPQAEIHLTEPEARRLRDHLNKLLTSTVIPPSPVGQAALAVDAARRKGTQ